MLERGDCIGYVWANLYDSLTLHTGKHMSSLPGMKFSRATPLFVPRAQFVSYLQDYARRFDLPVRTGWDVVGVPDAVDGDIDPSHQISRAIAGSRFSISQLPKPLGPQEAHPPCGQRTAATARGGPDMSVTPGR